MELHKRLDYGFNGYQVPPIPRATRSARGRGNIRKKYDGNEMCAFDLLTTVAGKLLLDGESTPNSIENASVKEKSNDEGGCERGFFISPIVSEAPVLNRSLSELTDTLSGPASIITSSDCSEKLGPAEKFINGNSKNEAGDCSANPFSSSTLGGESKKKMKIDPLNDAKFPDLWDRKPSMHVASDNTIKLSLSTDPDPFRSFPVTRNDVKLPTKDDDEKSCGCTRNKSSRPAPRVNVDSETRSVYQNGKNEYKSQRPQRDFPFKKRKLFYSFSNSDGGSSDGICSSPTKDLNRDAAARYNLAYSGAGTSISRGACAPFRSSDSRVKLKIKSFRIPELFIEIPETATVGSLKRTVMEAVTAILGGGIHIGVVFQGKKVRDDSKTLLLAGISHDDKLDALGFTLEPNQSRASPTLGPEARSCVDTPQPLTRCAPAHTVINGIRQGTYNTYPDHPGTSLNNNFIDSDHDSASSPPDEKNSVDSRALVPLAAVSAEALAVVPARKPKRSETAQRRIRRPFSVSEVEALVQAVEKLGTGRWRDVKMRAFDNAKHRTYVDLKDKWKTLVHTARISPQQRRGEPVPQELLDRVLIAHAYWSQQQAKQQMKHHSETRLLL